MYKLTLSLSNYCPKTYPVLLQVFQEFYLLVVQEDVPVVEGVRVEFLSDDILAGAKLVDVVTKEAVRPLYHQLRIAQI